MNTSSLQEQYIALQEEGHELFLAREYFDRDEYELRMARLEMKLRTLEESMDLLDYPEVTQ